MPHGPARLLPSKFEAIGEEEINRELRERRRREHAVALERVPVLDPAGTEWPDLPNAEVVNASIYAARGRVNGYPDRLATRLRRRLAARHDVEPEQIVVGNGAAELLQTAAHVLLEPGDELVTPWPSYPLYRLMAQRAGGRPVAVDLAAGRIDPEAVLAAVTERTRVVTICNPNDPTGTYLASSRLAELLAALPERVHVLLDEAYTHFQDVEDRDAGLALLEAFPRLLVLRTCSKVYGLSGLRAGYVVGSPQAGGLLDALAPALGVNPLSQAAAEQALKIGDGEIERRRTLVVEQRGRLLDALSEMPVDAPPSEANFVWLRAARLNGAELAARLEEANVRVAAGGPLGDSDHVRAAIRGGRRRSGCSRRWRRRWRAERDGASVALPLALRWSSPTPCLLPARAPADPGPPAPRALGARSRRGCPPAPAGRSPAPLRPRGCRGRSRPASAVPEMDLGVRLLRLGIFLRGFSVVPARVAEDVVPATGLLADRL